jgi:hypothetical protein
MLPMLQELHQHDVVMLQMQLYRYGFTCAIVQSQNLPPSSGSTKSLRIFSTLPKGDTIPQSVEIISGERVEGFLPHPPLFSSVMVSLRPAKSSV